jgi:hypothetical protein
MRAGDSWLGWLLGWLMFLFYGSALASASQVNYSSSHQQLLMQAQLVIDLPQEIRQAIAQEIPILFKTRIRLQQQRNLFIFHLPKPVQRFEYQTELRYSHFYQTYTLHNLRNGNRLSFSQLDEALMVMGRFQDFPITDLSQLHTGLDYQLQVAIAIDWRQLPATLFSHALFNQAWQYSTGWINQPVTLGVAL